jgi:hypothetical protein
LTATTLEGWPSSIHCFICRTAVRITQAPMDRI